MKFCTDKLRTDGFVSQHSNSYSQFQTIIKKGETKGLRWALGFILMFVTDVQWRTRTLNNDGNRLESLLEFESSFRETDLFFWTTEYDNGFVQSFNHMREMGKPLYISFKDLFFRIYVQMALNTVYFDTNTAKFVSRWTEDSIKTSDAKVYIQRINTLGQVYQQLDSQRIEQNATAFTGNVEPPAVLLTPALLACVAVGTTGTLIQFDIPADGASFAITAVISFAGETVTRWNCLGDEQCETMFVGETNTVVLNNTHRGLQLNYASMFLLEDISFQILFATGANPLYLKITTPRETSRKQIILHAILYWQQKNPVYRECTQGDSTASHAIITDPVAFTEIREVFRERMCTNIDYV